MSEPNLPSSNRLRRTTRIVCLTIVAIGASLIWISGVGRVHGEWVRRFDSEAWKSTPARGSVRSTTRHRMVDELLRRAVLIGRTRGEAEALIGPPDEKEYFAEYDMVHYLGDERGFMSIDSEWLVIKLDDTGRVSEARLFTD